MATISLQYADVLRSPRITEKGAISAEHNAYIFNIHPKATKTLVKNAIKVLYKVEPTKVTVVNTPAKRVFVRGKSGTTARSKKAYVFLKKGDQIQVI